MNGTIHTTNFSDFAEVYFAAIEGDVLMRDKREICTRVENYRPDADERLTVLADL